MATETIANTQAPAGRLGIDWAAWVVRARLWSGLTMFAYVSTHLLNHAVGIHSLAVLDWVQDKLFVRFWHLDVATGALMLAASVHVALAMWSIYRRRRLFAMRRWEAMQLILGLMIPPLIIEHVVITRVALELYEVWTDYPYVMFMAFTDPVRAWIYLAMIVVAWGHACMGLHFWLRYKPWYPDALTILRALALLIPVLAALGYWSAGKDTRRLLDDPALRAAEIARYKLPDQAEVDRLRCLRDGAYLAFALMLAGTLGVRLVRAGIEARRHKITVTYPGGQQIKVLPGPTLLEISRANAIPHASVCGGRGRCSTCRVKVGRGVDKLPAAAAEETRVLQRVGATERVRLACQTRPTADVEVMPLLPPSVAPAQSTLFPDYHHGRDMRIVVMFADLRGFTTFSESRLPYDVVFLLNRYFREMGEAITSAQGHVDKFIGDGIMALFGLDDGPDGGAVDGLRAARRMIDRLDALNAEMRDDLEAPLRIGIGLHVGTAIVGDLGWGTATTLTAIGDVVNTASRLEGLTKDYHCQIIASEEVLALAGLDMSAFEAHSITPRGKAEEIGIAVVRNLTALPA